MIEIRSATQYPTRYDAFDCNNVLFVNPNPKETGGNEWAVFNDDKRKIYGSIFSYQDKYLVLEIVTNGKVIFQDQFSYYRFERAKELLAQLLEKIPS